MSDEKSGVTPNYNIILKCRPGPDNEPVNDHFEYVSCDFPEKYLCSGEVLIENLYLSIDPAQRCQMNEDTGADYLNPWQVDETVIGLAGIGRIIQTASDNYKVGDLVQGTLTWPWKKYFTLVVNENNEYIQKVHQALLQQPSLSLGVLSGLTSIIGIREVGKVKPGQTCVISGAAGSCGSIAGQVSECCSKVRFPLVAKCDGGRVVGICGSDEKCTWITKDLGFVGAINYKTDNIKMKLEELCPDGIDVYFDNVGGEISNTVIKMMNTNSVVILCGQISQYNKDVPYPPPIPEEIQEIITKKNIARSRYLVLHYKDKFEKYSAEYIQLVLMGKIVYRETVEKGLENAGKAFVSMMKGGNIGKQVVFV